MNLISKKMKSVFIPLTLGISLLSGNIKQFPCKEKDIYLQENKTEVLENDKGKNEFEKNVEEFLKKDTHEDYETAKFYNYVGEFLSKQSTSLTISYNGEVYGHGYLSITGKSNNKALSEEFYNILISFMKKVDIRTLELESLDNTFNFSKLDLSNVTDLYLVDIKDEIDSSVFKQKYDNLYFDNTSLKNAKKILSNCDVSNTQLHWYERGKAKGELKALLKFLNETNIHLESLYIDLLRKKDYNGLSQEELSLLSKVNVSCLDVISDGFDKPIDLDLTFNRNIRSFDLEAYNNYPNNAELGNIKLKSNNKTFYCDFRNANITKNTHFSVSNSFWVGLKLLTCSDISAFSDLSNVEYLYFIEDIGPGPEAMDEGAIVYCATPGRLGEKILGSDVYEEKIYNNYNEVIKDLKRYYTLKKIRSKLNVSSDEISHYNYDFSIGDIVNLTNNNVPIYESIDSLSNKENAKTSLFGTSILRCIKSIVMVKGNIKKQINNMDEYERLIDKGFSVAGFNLVNQYSLSENGELTSELYCAKEDTKLILTPFK